jgi:hypothetical protein
MNRTSKALARLGTGTVVAATLLAMPFAIGTASADIGATPATTNGGVSPTAAQLGVGSQQAVNTNPGTVTVSGQATTDTVTIAIAGSSTAYFPTTQGANAVATTATEATCTGATSCTANVDDTVSEAVELEITDNTTHTTTTAKINFNGLTISGCPTTGIDSDGSTDGVATANCVTQGTVNTPLTLTSTYEEGGIAAANKAENVSFDTQGTAVFSSSQPAGTSYVDPSDVNCTTSSTGTCAVNVLDAKAETIDVAFTVSHSTNPNYPTANAAVQANILAASVAPTRLDLISSTVIAPTGVTGDAEPGEVVQDEYRLYGACTPSGGAAQCTGSPLVNDTVTLKVDHGFFTPNCAFGTPATSGSGETLADNIYANCSFNATPAAGTKVGDIKSSGTSVSATTDANGYFTASIGIGRDTAFDADGFLVATVTATSGSTTLTPEQSGNTNAATATACNGEFQPATNTTTVADGGQAGCADGILWTTDEAPLNGGTAKLAVIAPLTSPTGTDNPDANNYKAVDTGTNNVPDVDRVVYTVQLTDQFGNLTSGGGSSNAPTLSKTGAGNLVTCDDFSATDTCSDGFSTGGSQQPDGTFDQTLTAVGSYSDDTTDTQQRYEADAGTYEDGPDSGQAGINDGTQTDSLSWSAPATTFTVFTPGTTATPAFAQYSVGTSATALTDSLAFNFYNQLSDLKVTFSVTPSAKVAVGAAVTVATQILDQYGNPVVDQLVQFVRSGAIESSCQPQQNGNGNGAEYTNANGTAGFTFSCSESGLSTVSIAVTGPGGTQLAGGKEVVQFGTGTIAKVTIHPSLQVVTSNGHVQVVVYANGGDAGASVTIFRSGQAIHVGTLKSSGSFSYSFKAKKHHKVTVYAKVGAHGNYTSGKTKSITKRVK